MTNYRKILEMHFQGFSQRSIEANVHSSHQTVKTVLDRAKELNISWPLDDDVTNEMLDELFYSDMTSSGSAFLAADWCVPWSEIIIMSGGLIFIVVLLRESGSQSAVRWL
ncbi:MAG: hypothetical protein K6C68_02510 [Ruminococcus sp.]|nr:hypothetical protein [Ruminococcus sp.]